MTTPNNTTESNSVETSPSGDNSQEASGEDSQPIDWQARAEVAEASNTKLTGDLSRETGRVAQLRKERESSSEGFMAGVGNSLNALAQASETGNNEGLASMVKGFMTEASAASAQAKNNQQLSRYEGEIADAIAGAGMNENDSSLNEASTLFSNAQTMAEKAEAVTMVERITNAKKVSDAQEQATASAKTAEETRDKTLKETGAHNLNPSSAGSGGSGSSTNNSPSNNQVIGEELAKQGGLESAFR